MIMPVLGAIMWLKLVKEGFVREETINPDLRGWAESRRETLAFQLALRDGIASKFKSWGLTKGSINSLLSL